MPGARPSTYRKSGGGFFTGDAVITDYRFVNGDSTPVKSGPRKGESFTPLSVHLSARFDGAEEAITKFLFVGNGGDFEITDDGRTLVPVDGEMALWEGCEWCMFVGTLCGAGFDEGRLSEDAINYEPIIGTRCQFAQVTDEAKTKKLGKRKYTGRDGKEHEADQQMVVVKEVYAMPTATKSTAKATTTRTVAATKPNGRAKEVSIEELTDQTILAVLAKEKNNTIAKKMLGVKVHMALGAKDPSRDEVRQLSGTDDHLNAMVERGLITYEGDTVALA